MPFPLGTRGAAVGSRTRWRICVAWPDPGCMEPPTGRATQLLAPPQADQVVAVFSASISATRFNSSSSDSSNSTAAWSSDSAGRNRLTVG